MVRRLSAPRPEFDAAAIYQYPEHLRPSLEAMPSYPVSIFSMVKAMPCRSISVKA